MVSKVLFSSKKKDCKTPRWLFKKFDRAYKFTVDAAAHRRNRQLKRFWGPGSKEQKDSLAISWQGERCWLNPEYGRGITGKWVRKAYRESQKPGTLVAVLIPARTDQWWWHRYALRSHSIIFIEGRVHFDGADHGAPFPSAVLIFKITKRKQPKIYKMSTPQVRRVKDRAKARRV